MLNTPFADWWADLLAMGAIVTLLVCFIMQLCEWGVHPLRDVSRILHRPWFERLVLLTFACGLVQYGATKGTGGRSSAPIAREGATNELITVQAQRDGIQPVVSVTNLCFTAISVSTNGVGLSLAWPTNFFLQGTTLDFFAKYDSWTNAWRWFASYLTLPDMTNLSVVAEWQDDLDCASNPPAMFFKVQDRTTCATTMADADCDGLPDVYELNNGTNPYVSDYALAPKLTVGADGAYGTLVAALAACTNYSIVEVSSEIESFDETIRLPSHPVLITGPQDGYARIYSSANIATFLMDAGQDCETSFRNLYVVLTARDNFQSAFWIGGNLPWSGVGASPAFENVRVRAFYPNVLHYGWHYYRDDHDCSFLSNCTMNAAGSTSAIGLYSYGGPNIVTSVCAFVNFPINAGNYVSWIKAGTNIVATLPTTNTNLSWAGYALDESYSSTADSDGDGLSDYAEIHVNDTDPWLSDSDGDGLTDAEEVVAGTDPQDIYSFYRRITVVTTASDDLADTTNYVAWGTSAVGWETNDMSSCWILPATNTFFVTSTNGPMYVKSYRDLNRNGQYDSETDIILIRQVPPLDAVSAFVLQFGDIDGDGVSDVTERQDGSDPYDNGSFFLRATVICANSDVSDSVTNYLGLSGCVDSARESFVGSGSLSVVSLVTNGVCDVLCLRDFNGNGIYDEGQDVLYIHSLAKEDNGKTVTMSIGDADKDGQSDFSELSRGTNPIDAKNYCFNLSFVEKGIFCTTNALTAEVLFGTNVMVGPIVMTNRTWEIDLGHLDTTNRESVVAYFWDDANSNSVRDVGECFSQQAFAIHGHDNVLTNTLSVKPFDHDNDGMLDYWEILHADADLSPTNAADAFLDFDSDGLINLHEYWAKCNPSLADGSNTLLSVTARSIDDRLSNLAFDDAQLRLFANYPINYEATLLDEDLSFNSNCWARSIDFSCVSPWNEKTGRYRAGTAISRRHVLFARHYWLSPTNIYFVDRDGITHTNKIVATRTDETTDFGVALLQQNLPLSIHPAKIFSPQDIESLCGGRGVPLVAFDQDECVLVHEVSAWDNNVSGEIPKIGCRTNYFQNWIDKDSGNPRFAVVSNEAILANLAWYGGSGQGTSVTAEKTLLQGLMDQLSLDAGLSTNEYRLIEFSWQRGNDK